MTTIVTAQELTDRLAREIGILTVNNTMQQMQIEKLQGKSVADNAERLRMEGEIVTLRQELAQTHSALIEAQRPPSTKRKR